MDDIVFEGRNKEYGAYELRKINYRYALISLGIAIATYVLVVLLSQVEFKFLQNNNEEIDISVKSTQVELPEDVPDVEAPPPPPPPPPPEAPQIKFVEMVVKKDEEVADKEVTTQKELEDPNKNIGFENKEGDANAKPKISEPEPVKTGTGPVQPKKEEKTDDDFIFEIVEQQAEFPGGAAAMAQFIQKNLKYPEIALENGIEGTVVVEFVVERDGSITNIKVLKEIGAGCGNEAMRIVKLMPKWNPGKQRDMAVRVKMRAPIKFRIGK